MALPVPPLLRRFATAESVSLETDDFIMDFEHVGHSEFSSTVLQSNNHTDQPPPDHGASGTRRNYFGSNYPTMLERMDIDLAVCKAEITGLDQNFSSSSSQIAVPPR